MEELVESGLTLNQWIETNQHIENMANGIVFNETIETNQHVITVESVLPLEGIITFNISDRRDVVDSLDLEQTVVANQVNLLRLRHGLGYNSIIRRQKVLNKSVSSSLTLSQEIAFVVHYESIESEISLSQTIDLTHVKTNNVESELTLTQTVVNNKVHARLVESELVYLDHRLIYVGLDTISEVRVPNLQYTIIKPRSKRCSILKVANGSIVLPSPIFGDAESYGGLFTLRRSMTNVTYTYVRTLNLRKLKVNYNLAKAKALELKQFLKTHGSKIMTFLTWKGDTWVVNLLTNPIELTAVSRYQNENEAVDIELEFEGIKVM